MVVLALEVIVRVGSPIIIELFTTISMSEAALSMQKNLPHLYVFPFTKVDVGFKTLFKYSPSTMSVFILLPEKNPS